MAERVLGGRYTVQDRIGTGGMAIVYRGLDEVLGRTVAIKTMLPQYAADPSFAARFKQEAQAAAALQSPYIVSVYDWGKDGDTYYIVMEYLRGTDLKSGIRKHGALDSKKVAQIGSQIAQALSVAHRHDIIHRDIKPQNIMVQPDGNIKVMDFGIARAKNSHLTTDNSVLGTAHYVSPEQTQGKELGPTTDIYSLGIVMYEAATGRVPFDGDDAISVALKQVNEQPVPPTAVNPAVDSALESIILKCMQKDPKDRFQTADELYHVLRDYLAGRLAAVNNATEVLPANPVVPAIAPIGATSTQSLPRIDTAEHIKPQTATQKAQQEADAAMKKHKRRVALFSIIGVIALIVAIVGVYSLVNPSNQKREVPNYLSMTEADALKAIDESGFFKKGSVKEQYSSTVEKGVVMDQDPDSGRMVGKGTKINLVISKGKEPAATVKVPDLTEMSPSQADKALAKVGLVGQAGDSVYDENVAVGMIAKQAAPRPRPATPSPTSCPRARSPWTCPASWDRTRTPPRPRSRTPASRSASATATATPSRRATCTTSPPPAAPTRAPRSRSTSPTARRRSPYPTSWAPRPMTRRAHWTPRASSTTSPTSTAPASRREPSSLSRPPVPRAGPRSPS